MASSRLHVPLAGAVAALVLLASCVDSPSAPPVRGGAPGYLPPASLTLAGPAGGPATTAAQSDALRSAFQLVDGLRLRVRNQAGDLLADTLISVRPGQDEYDLRLEVEAAPGEALSVTVLAFQGERELFRSGAVPVEATATGASGGGGAPASIALSYSGPGAEAATLTLTPGRAVVGPGGSTDLSAEVRDHAGNVVTGVPLSWTVDGSGRAEVEDGQVTGLADGVAEVVATTPAGLEARASVYVVGGRLAYVLDGAVHLRDAAGGPATRRTGAGATQPAWSADGSGLWYVSGGQVRRAGEGSSLGAGSWPAPSPDGSKVAVERDGRIWLANEDGSHPTQGPRGRAPVWADGATLLVSGDGVERVVADGSARSVVAGGPAGPPAVSAAGRVAWVAAGELRVADLAGPLVEGASGRPSWSADGRWLVVRAGEGLVVVPSDGSAPAAPLPGLAGASDPAFQPTGGGAAPAPVSLEALEPDPPVPGREVVLRGSGFDWIIEANNRVTWPVRGGTVESELLSVSPGALRVQVPEDVVEGAVRVATRGAGEAALPFRVPRTLEVRAATPGGTPVAGADVTVRLPDGSERAGATDAAGEAVFDDLPAGEHAVTLTPPVGFRLYGGATRTVDVGPGLTRLEVSLLPELAEVTLVPSEVSLPVGGSADVHLVAVTATGDTVDAPGAVEWSAPGGDLGVAPDGLRARLTGTAPSTSRGASTLRVRLLDSVREFPVTVTSAVAGVVRREVRGEDGSGGSGPSLEPAPGVDVEVRRGDALMDRTRTRSDGSWRVAGLLAGTYTVTPLATDERTPEPLTAEVVLDRDHPTGAADFVMALGGVASLELAFDGPLEALGARSAVAVTPRDEAGEPVELPGPPAFASSSPEVATVDDGGKVTAVSNGDAWIRVSVEDVVDSVRVSVDQAAATLVLVEAPGATPSPDSSRAFVGDTATALWRAEDARGHPVQDGSEPTFSSSDGAVLAVTDGGFTEALAAGRAILTAELDGAADAEIVHVVGEHEGDWIVEGAADLAAFADAGIGRVTGDLRVVGTSLASLEGLEALRQVGGSLVLEANVELTDLSALSGLASVGLDVVVSGNARLRGLDALTGLERVPGQLRLVDNPALRSVGNLPAVTHVGDLWLRSGAAVFGMPGLRSVGHGVVADTLPGGLSALEELHLPALRVVGETVTLFGQPSLSVVELGALEEVAGSAPPAAAGVALRATTDRGPRPPVVHGAREALRSLGGVAASPPARLRRDPSGMARHESRTAGIFLTGNPALATLDLASLRTVGGWLYLAGGMAMDALAFPALTQVGQNLGIWGLTGPTEVAFPALEEVGWDFYPFHTGPDDPTLARILAPRLRTARTVVLAVGASLERADLSGLEEAFRAWIATNGSPETPLSLELDALATLEGELDVVGNAGLTELSLPSLTAVRDGRLTVANNPDLTTLSAPALASVGREVRLVVHPALDEVDLGSLGRVGMLVVQDNDALGALARPALSSITGAVSAEPETPRPAAAVIRGNAALTGFDLSALGDVALVRVENNGSLATLGSLASLPAGASVEVGGNPGLVDLAGLADVTALERLVVHGNIALPSLELTALRTVAGELRLEANDALASASFPALERIGDGGPGPQADGGSLVVDGHPSLAFIVMPSLVSATGTLQITGNGALPDLGFLTGVTSALRQVRIVGNGALDDLDGLSGVGTETDAAPAVLDGLTVADNLAPQCHLAAVLDRIAARNGGDFEVAFPGGYTAPDCAPTQEE